MYSLREIQDLFSSNSTLLPSWCVCWQTTVWQQNGLTRSSLGFIFIFAYFCYLPLSPSSGSQSFGSNLPLFSPPESFKTLKVRVFIWWGSFCNRFSPAEHQPSFTDSFRFQQPGSDESLILMSQQAELLGKSLGAAPVTVLELPVSSWFGCDVLYHQ